MPLDVALSSRLLAQLICQLTWRAEIVAAASTTLHATSASRAHDIQRSRL